MFPFGGLIITDPPNEISLPGNISVFDFGIWPGTVTAGIEVQQDGAIQLFDSGGVYFEYGNSWMENTGRTPTIGNDYEVFMATGGPDAPSGSATNVWLQLNGLRSWFLSSSSKFASEEFNSTLQVRQISNPSNITGLANIQLMVEQEF